ncbi:hypothetical protein TRFO_17305 [Tritrichomonas foetus]|uniref:protein disulfide-isomerase n=1 Tax=Tritrichomonas foetus TaxID=1144522 RepID=A0A1J4KPB6_9EUKA|nr:hypothetical protein TRFO_17305 [Tritrichomonas foetus]|eukprot:OHT12760.1 hypothetical protein TRFO_17305 [Tritrichomonas foetus]
MLDFMDYAIFKYKENVSFARANYSLAADYDCSREPCILAFNEDRMLNIGEAPFDLTLFAVWAQHVFNPKSIRLNFTEQIRAFFNLEGVNVIGVDTEDAPSTIPSNLPFYSTTAKALSRFQINVPKGIYIYRHIDRQFIPYNGNFAEESKSIFSPPNIYQKSTKEFFSGFLVSDDQDAQPEIDAITKIYAKHSAKTDFVLVSDRQGRDIISMGSLSKAHPPYFFTFHRDNFSLGRYLVFDEKRFDSEFLDGYLTRIEQGKENFSHISAVLNDPPDATFRQVNTDTYHKTVNDPERDILVAITAPWCHHCKDFKPVLNISSQLLKNEKVGFYWIDGTTNELPSDFPSFDGYPTLFLFAAKNKTASTFDGKRTVSGILEYLHKEGSFNFTDPEFNQTEIDERLLVLRAIEHKK